MKHLKLLLSLVFIFTITLSGFSQDKMSALAVKKMAEVNQQLEAGGGAKLDAKQEKAYKEAFIENQKKINNVRKTVKDKAEKQTKIKALYSEFGKVLKSEVLTKEQSYAKSKGRKALKK
ncbi:hypothetical protein [Lutibacter citreus]|uniref:hypothetical protein n=1 Tax=Lutibacter citreus TaxID=2138210 RepID=UPI000DBE857E|nr:hypothetical protein [Lutibacter citreus]